MIAIIHAYSRRNAGDGLLVDHTFERLTRAGVGSEDCVVFALDPGSFDDLPRVKQIGVPGRRVGGPLLRATAQAGAALGTRLTRGQLQAGNLANELERASVIIGVGGGYLRSDGLISSLGTMVNHLPQLATASVSNARKLYLPQSIGPLRGPVGRLVKRYLRDIDTICVRDHPTTNALEGLNVHRIPDLAVLRIGEKSPEGISDRSGPVICVARELGRDPEYAERLRSLARQFPEALWAVQAEGVGSKHDGLFYRNELGLEPAGRLNEILEKHPNSVVVSVRLHGALEAVSKGVPAIHLAYQRKGPAAFSDLGLEEYVHDGRTFSPALVSRQVLALRSSSKDYWRRIANMRTSLCAYSAKLDSLISETLS